MTGEAVDSFRGAWESVMLLSMGEKIERADRKARANTNPLKKLDLHWHDLRHECASRWRESGLDLEVIRRLLGHSTLLVTQRYLNINEDELVEAMQQKIWKRA
jgi:site-specific recombinase XerD